MSGWRKAKIHGMITSKATAGNGYPGMTRLLAGERRQLFQQEPVIEGLLPGALRRWSGLVIPARCIHAVGTVDLYLAILQEPPGRIDQSLRSPLFVVMGCRCEVGNRMTG